MSLEDMRNAPRCGAKNRQGNPCQLPAMRGKKRCRLHGGKSTGAPGNKNAWKHGYYSGEAVEARRATTALIRESCQYLASVR